jgi:hypothetical protein
MVIRRSLGYDDVDHSHKIAYHHHKKTVLQWLRVPQSMSSENLGIRTSYTVVTKGHGISAAMIIRSKDLARNLSVENVGCSAQVVAKGILPYQAGQRSSLVDQERIRQSEQVEDVDLSCR